MSVRRHDKAYMKRAEATEAIGAAARGRTDG